MTRLALLVPALDEELSMERTASVMRGALEAGVVDRAVVLDGGSTDGTPHLAREHGVEVLTVRELFGSLGAVLGKGDSLFRGVHHVEAEGYVFLDADLGNVSVAHVAALAGALGRPGAALVKGGFVRVDENGVPREIPGGRVTEEVGRPLLEQVDPWLARLSQPLSGQVACDGALARSLTFATGYGVEIAMLIDVWGRVGRDGIDEADLGRINNRWKPDGALDDVRDQVVAGAALRGVALPGWGRKIHPLVVSRSNANFH